MFSRPPYCVPEESYQQLIDKLQSAVPKSMSMIGSLRNVLRGRLTANFYVDKWPDFTAVVCQYIWPRRSDVADIGAYATSSEALLSVLTEGNLVTWGKRQEFQRIEERHADYLLAHLKRPGMPSTGLKCVHKRVPVYNSHVTEMFKGDICQAHEKLYSLMPDGLVLGELRPHHAKMVSTQWPRLKDWPNKEPYFKELIKSYPCPAIYSVDNLDEPASYIVQFPCNQTFGYTNEKYTGRKLVFLPWLHFFFGLAFSDRFLAFEEEVSVTANVPIFQELGSDFSGYFVKDLVIESIIHSKL